MFQERLKDLRIKAGLTQKQVAEHFNIKQPTYAQWENGRTKPKEATLKKFAQYFNVSIDYLTGKSDIKDATAIDEDKLDQAIEKSLGFNGKPATESEKASMKEALMIYLESLKDSD
ncbi:helix-turn-helix domain-containing protein [Streptococcus sp. S784/96/1]|uniref:helix-turn-helix domain-containing protein n=1 Tax=Streptococcus sp. S784/96/1 TaxID=2653499 RepID=UPI0013869B32|nr:helix-turn-helix transcriptional regulator [Streptococcus sp. S784/96/1]